MSFGRALRETTHLEERVSALPRYCVYSTYIYNIIILHSLQTSISRSNRRQRSHVPTIEPSASENGSDPEQPQQQRQQQFLRQPSQQLKTSEYLFVNECLTVEFIERLEL